MNRERSKREKNDKIIGPRPFGGSAPPPESASANDYFSQMKSPTVMTAVRVCMFFQWPFTIFNSECVCTMGILYNVVNKT